MKILKFSFAFTLALFMTAALTAQAPMGVDYFLLGEHSKAKMFFEKELTSNPEMANFYLGQIAYLEQDTQKAEEFYKKGLSANPNSAYNAIGMAKLQLKSDPKGGESALLAIAKKNKKDIDAVVAVGRAFMAANMFKQAEKIQAEAKKAAGKNPVVYVFEGDLIFASNNMAAEKAGEAGGKYEMATYFDENYPLGYLKTAQIYQKINAVLATQKLETLIEKNPNYTIAYGMLGKLYAQRGFYEKAIESFKKYFEAGIYSTDDIEMYARVNYFSDLFDKANELVNNGLQNDPNHFVLNRYKMYISAKSKDTNGLKDAEKFFSLRDTGYISLDYSMYAMILDNAQRYKEAFAQYNKAISMDPSNIEIYNDAISAARKRKDYALAATYLKTQMDKKAELGRANDPDYVDDVADIAALGDNYYLAGSSIGKTPELATEYMKDKSIIDMLAMADPSLSPAQLAGNAEYFTKAYSLYYLQKADGMFDALIARIPESYQGYRYKALTQHGINDSTELGLAKPHYEKVVEILEKVDELTAANKRVLLEAYNYLGYYFYMKNDKDNTVLYWGKVLEIDPQNANAKLVLDAMKNEGK